jgi:antitoxin component YwqK of YwqJK toxin-antitoxin module
MQTRLIILAFLTLTFCNSDKDAVKYAKDWSKQMKDKIIVSNVTSERLKSDSDTVHLTKNDLELINTVAGGVLGSNDSIPPSNAESVKVLYYASDSSVSYEIRRYKDGGRSFNGIRINDQYQGWCEWFDKSGNILKEGAFINGKPVGLWNFYSESNVLDSTANFGRTELIYSTLKYTNE